MTKPLLLPGSIDVSPCLDDSSSGSLRDIKYSANPRKVFFAGARRYLAEAILLSVSGSLLALSSPGMEQYFLAWFCITPLFVAIYTSASKAESFARSFVFGCSYNLVYFYWFLALHENWAIFSPDKPLGTAIALWLFVGFQQGLLFGAFGCAVRGIPQCAGLLPSRRNGSLHYPALVVVPLLWVLLFNKQGLIPFFLGVPWSMIEYSQYRVAELLQVAPYIGGIGIGALIVMTNVALGLFALRVRAPAQLKLALNGRGLLLHKSRLASVLPILCMSLLVFAFYLYGVASLKCTAVKGSRSTQVSLLQGNVNANIDNVDPIQTVERYLAQSRIAPPGICVWPEWSVAINLQKYDSIIGSIKKIVRDRHQDWLLGTLQKTLDDKRYNIVCAFSSDGEFLKPAYRKRLMVPIGEYIPWFIKYSPLNQWIGTCTPYQHDYDGGTKPIVYSLPAGKVSPLICLEVVSPEMTSENVRAGAEMLLDSSNTVWFRSPVVGLQMVAFSAFRAAETGRYVGYATTKGPSAMLDANGRIVAISPYDKSCIVSGKAFFRDELTPFVKWFR